MKEKLSFQNLSESLSKNSGVSNKVADTFAKAFFDTIVDALYMGETAIKIKGLGTFKLVDVESRESVNVANGERIVIAGYKKVSFVPDDSIVEKLNDAADEENAPVAELANSAVIEEPTIERLVDEEEPVEAVIEEPTIEKLVDEEEPEEAVIEEIEEDIEELVNVDIPATVEVPADDLSGIDMLISTPESVDEIRAQYKEAKALAEAAIEEARKANAERLRLEILLGRLEANVKPETEEEQPVAAEEEGVDEQENIVAENESEAACDETAASEPEHTEEVVEEAVEETQIPAATDAKDDAFERLAAESPVEEESTPWYKKSSTWWITVPLLLLLCGSIYYFLAKTHASVENVVDAEVISTAPEKKPFVMPAAPAPAAADSVAAKKKDSIKVSNTPAPVEVKEEKKPEAPKTYIMKKGDSLTRISQKFYGTKDSVSAIIRINQFSDPNNVPIGAKIYLP